MHRPTCDHHDCSRRGLMRRGRLLACAVHGAQLQLAASTADGRTFLHVRDDILHRALDRIEREAAYVDARNQQGVAA